MTKIVWHLVTGEYPPQSGGVSDYTAILAAGLAADGADVHVWAPPFEGITPVTDGVTIRRCAGKWSSTDLTHLSDSLNGFVAPRRLLVQYTPNAWGYKGLNFRFCHWLGERRKAGDDIRLMVHEPFYPWRLWEKPTHWLLAAGQRQMIRTLLSASSHVYLSIPGWEKRLRFYEAGNRRLMTWLPIFSTIPVVNNAPKVAQLRQRLAPEGQTILANFGTFGGAIGKVLFEAFPHLLINHPARVGLLLGRGGERFAARLRATYPKLAGSILAPGNLPPEMVSLHLQACDLLIQPYPDGVSSRRTSIMAGLSHGLPIVTQQGFLSEPLWSQTGCVKLVLSNDTTSFLRASESLLADPTSRANLGARAREAYLKRFTLERTLETLRS